MAVRAIMTRGAQEFVTPLSVGALTGGKVFTDLFDREDEQDVGHIRLAREADLVVVAPATADIMAKMAGGHADDLATAVLLATDKPGAACAGDEPGDVGAPGDTAQRRAARRGRHPLRRPRAGRDGGGGRGGLRPHGRAARDPRGALDRLLPTRRRRPAPRRPACGRHLGADARADRSGPLSSPTAPRASRATPLPPPRPRQARGVTLVSGPVAIPDPPGVRVVHVEIRPRDAGRGRGGAARRRRGLAAAVADWRPAEAATRQDQEGRQRQGPRRCSWSRTPTSSPPSAAITRCGRRSSSASPPRPPT